MKINHNLSIQDGINLAKNLGCNVQSKHRHGEIVFKHFKILKPYTISNTRKVIGRDLLNWMKPLLEEENTTLEPNTIIYKIAETGRKIIGENTTTEITIDSIHNNLPECSRKQVSDNLTHLVNRNYFNRTSTGIFQGTEKLFNEIKLENKNLIIDQDFNNRLEKIETMINSNITSFMTRFEENLNKLDKLIKRFQHEADITDAIIILEDALKKKSKGL